MTGTAAPASCWACGAPAGPSTDLPPLWGCARCGLHFDAQVSASEAAARYGDEYFAGYAQRDYEEAEAMRRREARVRLDLIESYVLPPARLFEAGAAAGFFLDEAQQRGFEVGGVEPNERLAAGARERFAVDVTAGTVEAIDLAETPAAAICAWHVLEHLVEPLRVLERMRGWLAPGGLLFLELPNADSALARRLGAAWEHRDLLHHVGQYGPRSLRALLGRAGYEPVLLDTIPFATYLPPSGLGPLEPYAHALLGSLRARAPIGTRPHPVRHELLRAVARPQG